jgi:hypothetical protein
LVGDGVLSTIRNMSLTDGTADDKTEGATDGDTEEATEGDTEEATEGDTEGDRLTVGVAVVGCGDGAAVEHSWSIVSRMIVHTSTV